MEEDSKSCIEILNLKTVRKLWFHRLIILTPSHPLVFLDPSNAVKLGDFGLAKQMGPASFANTYVGVSLVTASFVTTN